MGCASSKPSSKSKSKSATNGKQKSAGASDSSAKNNASAKNATTGSNANVNLNANGQLDNKASNASPLHIKQQQQQDRLKKLSVPIQLDSRHLINEIERNRDGVIDYLVRVVHRELNAELIANSNPKANLAEVVLAASTAHDNDDLITDVVSRAVLLILSGQLAPGATYKDLNDQLKQHQYLCKHQTHKTRICELTVDTIRACLDSINDELKHLGDRFSLFDFLNHLNNDSSSSSAATNGTTMNGHAAGSQHQHQQLTPPISPKQNAEKQKTAAGYQETTTPDWQDAVLLSRAQAKEVARILFLSDRARPVVHASPKSKDAYFVNKQLNDNSEITVSQQEIDEILNSFDKPEIIEIKDDYYFNGSNGDNHLNHHHQPDSPTSIDNSSHEHRYEPASLPIHQTQSLTNTPSHVYQDKSTSSPSSNQHAENSSTDHRPVNLLKEFEKLVATGESNGHNNNNNNNLTTVTIDEDMLNTNNNKSNVTIEYEVPTRDQEDADTESALAAIAAASVLIGHINNASAADNENKSEEPSITVVKMQTTTVTTTTVTTSGAGSGDSYEEEEAANSSLDSNNNLDNTANNTTTTTTTTTTHDTSENGNLDPILKQSLLDDRFYNNHSFKTEAPVNGENTNAAATIIQSSFRGHTERRDVSDSKNDHLNQQQSNMDKERAKQKKRNKKKRKNQL